jgi:hypothetical protein
MKITIPFFLIMFLLSFMNSVAISQNREISGFIHLFGDKKEPISFANVVVKGTTIGTISDFEGKFKLSIPTNTTSIHISAIGYESIDIDISNQTKSWYSVGLKEQDIELDEIVVNAGINPALLIQKNIVRNRKRNDPMQHNAYLYTKYMKHQFFLSQVDEKFKNSVFFRKNQDAFFKFSEKDSLESMPISFHELITEEFKQKFPPKQRTTIKGENYTGVSAFKESELNNFIGIVETNFYQNYMLILDKDFISPLSNIGPVFYEYYIRDTIIENENTFYIIRFKPRRVKDLVFEGTFSVNMSDFSVAWVDAKVSSNSNVNFIKNMNIYQEYQAINDSSYFFNKEQVVVDFYYSPRKDTTKNEVLIRSSRSLQYSNIVLNMQSLEEISKEAIAYEVLYDDSENIKDSSFWETYRKEFFDSTDLKSLNAINQVNNIGIVKLTDKALDAGLNGYISTKYIDWGPWEEMLQRNSVEGWRIAAIGRTSALWTGNHAISAFVAYGTEDKRWKYGGGYAVELLGGRYRQFAIRYADNTISIGNYQNNLLFLRENLVSPVETNIFSSLAGRVENYKLYRIKEAEVKFEQEWTPGFINKIQVNFHKHYSPEFFNFTKNNILDTINNFNSAEISLITRITWDETILTKHFRRVYMGTKKPRIYLNIIAGGYEIDEKTEPYFKLRFVMRHYFPLLNGKLMCNYEAGNIWGQLPYPILEISRGNESFGYARFSYNLMDKMEFVHDRFVGTMIEYATPGVVFKHIPLLKKMNLRENVTFKSQWGQISDKHKEIMDFPQFMSPLESIYAEAGFGITNIFKILRLQWSWRLTQLDKPDVLPYIMQASLLIEF